MTMASSSATLSSGPAAVELDEETDALSTLSTSLSLIFQIASTSLYRLSSSQHLQLNPLIPTHVHVQSSGSSGAQNANPQAANSSGGAASNGLVPPNEMAEDIKELVDDFMDRIASMKEGIDALPVAQSDADHIKRVSELDEGIRAVNAEYEDCVRQVASLEKQVEALLDQSCL